MRSAVLADFASCPGVEVMTIPDGLPIDEEAALFRRLGGTCDWTLLIAPESAGILFDRCRVVEEAGGRLLGPDSAAVRLTGDKQELERHLANHGVPTPPCELWRDGGSPRTSFPLVCKPRDGAGSQATFLVSDGKELTRCAALTRSEGFSGELLLQPYSPGRPVSVAFLIGPNGRLGLPSVEQHLSEDGRFRYLGGSLPLQPEPDARARNLAGRALTCVAGLRGYVGVDLILAETSDADTVVEINPRLTTSYIGYRALARNNLAVAMLMLARGSDAPVLSWHRGPVQFTSQGTVLD